MTPMNYVIFQHTKRDFLSIRDIAQNKLNLGLSRNDANYIVRKIRYVNKKLNVENIFHYYLKHGVPLSEEEIRHNTEVKAGILLKLLSHL